MSERNAGLPARFWSKVHRCPITGCWLWLAGKNRKGYGDYWHDGATRIAHRVAYEVLVSPIPEGLQLDHLCRVPSCVAPWHMEPVTLVENVARSEVGRVNRAKTHCPAGHEYAVHASLAHWLRVKKRNCLACDRARNRKNYLARRAGALR